MKKLISVSTCLMVVLMFVVGSTCVFSMVQVGEEVVERCETPHPYPGEKGVVWERTFHWPNAGYVAIHFSKFDLAKGDRVEISSPDGRFRYIFEGKGKKVKLGKKAKETEISEFWATHIPGDMADVKLISKNKKGGWGFVIDKWARGYEKGYIEAVMAGLEEEAVIEAICNADDKEWAKCYLGTTMYDKAKAVCRLLIGGTSACTGWLLGSEGHVMTNNHCISTQSSASNTDYEFMAEGATCSTSCASWGACPGTVEASSGTLIKTNSTLDYTLILLPSNVTSTYGYLQLRDTLPTVGERIYIPQHPGAWGKQLAVNSDTDGPYAKVYSTNQTPCMGGPGDIGYYADTAGGSSGSPVLGYADHLVVALHHCANCPNRGVPIPSIITSLGTDMPNDGVGGGTGPTSYCASSGSSQAYEWIAGVQVGDLNNSSGASGYTDFTAKVAHLTPGASASVSLTPGFASSSYNEYWKIWIDYNGDKDFEDAGEEVFSGSGSSVVSGSFTVPSSASGQTRMRVSMRYGGVPPTCGTFTYGEVEDYTVDFSGAPPVTYCTSSGNSQSYEWIARVRVANLDNSSGASGYTDFTSKTANLTKGASASVYLYPGFASSSYNEYWKIWIDLNHDGDFSDSGEEVFSGSGSSTVSGSFTVPTSALSGSTRMRVSMRYGGWPPSCGTFTWGEVEDYTANIQ
ncbi:MAG: hypothetical protein GTO45_09720 [Candidatus Aminicenantes bacterium]|nr:hypothetical protein [Candidatus Aminicenantes bacterium]NIM79093.1 hypothetical protein [Candidatus Aminicenantes bacterium]NIN18372.1 hypothetical protein [Candidatus Aminicenantes bacterium]NIN42259.1 hypothetical protein [Candidatus Aminicenantes bacterium]NIN85025.1 hypothetical protein [Candidatus Aminicenantes bacterium]